VFIKRFLGAQADYIRHDDRNKSCTRRVLFVFGGLSSLFGVHNGNNNTQQHSK